MFKRIVLTFAACGVMVAISLGLLWAYLIGHTAFNPHNLPFLDNLTDWLWPSNIMTMAITDDSVLTSGVVLILSSIVNGIIYAVVGVVISGIYEFYLRLS